MATDSSLIPSAARAEQIRKDSILAANAAWSYPAHDDGWVRAHDALRFDMKHFQQALEAVVQRLSRGDPLQPWVSSHLQKYWLAFNTAVLHHHANEENIMFPEFSKRFSVPEKLSADHGQLLESLDGLRAALTALKPPTIPADDLVTYEALLHRFAALRTDMEAHLLEEEENNLPLMRTYMTQKEYKSIEMRVVRGLSFADLGWLLRAFPDDEDRRRWMTAVGRIPGLVQVLIMMPAARKYRKHVDQLVLDVQSGEMTVPEPRGCLGLW